MLWEPTPQPLPRGGELLCCGSLPPTPPKRRGAAVLWEPIPNPSQEEGSCCAEYTCFKVICGESAWHSLPLGGQGWAP